MKVSKIISSILIFIILISLLLPRKFFADWAYSFVVYDGYTYVTSDENVTDIDKEIGQVTLYSDKEGSYYGNFSNTYKKGTKYYSIKGVSTDTAIAVNDNGKYIKAIKEGEYLRRKYSHFTLIIGGAVICLIFALLIFMVQKNVTSSKYS
jgi:hypothetical protein